jgi:hypothetical protein
VRDFLAIPATLVLSECVFSIGSNVVTKKQNKLTRNLVQMIICLKDWGIITDDMLKKKKKKKSHQLGSKLAETTIKSNLENDTKY